MNKHECYVVDGCVDFIPVKRSTLTPNGVEVTIVGSAQKERVLVDRVYQMAKIFEPQKPVIPQFVADKIEYCKKTGEYGLFHAMDYCYEYKESSDWLECNEETFALAWIYGYTVEKDKLYTVEIPNPNGVVVCLERLDGGKIALSTFGESELTETEIKQDFEWAWQFAKEVG